LVVSLRVVSLRQEALLRSLKFTRLWRIGHHREVGILLFEIPFVAWMVAAAVEIDEDRERRNRGDNQVHWKPGQGKKEHQWACEQSSEQAFAQDRPARFAAGRLQSCSSHT